MLGKYLRPTAWAGIQPGFAQPLDDFFIRQPRDALEVIEFNHGEGFQVHVGEGAFQPAQQVKVVVELERRMQSADDVDFRDTSFIVGPDFGNGLLDGVGVGPFLSGLAVKRAKRAVPVADVRWVEVMVDIVVSHVAMSRAADGVGQVAEQRDRPGFKQGHPVVEGKPLTGLYFLGNAENRVTGHKYRLKTCEMHQTGVWRQGILATTVQRGNAPWQAH